MRELAHFLTSRMPSKRMKDMGHEGRAAVKDGKKGDEDDQVDLYCVVFP